MYEDDEWYCACEGMDICETCDDWEEGEHCETCVEMNTHDCEVEGCYGENPNAHIEVFGTYAPGSEFDNYYNS